MPQFILNGPSDDDDFVAGYIEAMFFTNGDTGDERENLLNDLGTERLTRAARKSITADCRAFLSQIMPDGCFARQWLDRAEDYDDEQAGQDFWFTRQHHGAGFWDRDELPKDLRDGLTAAAKAQGEASCETHRGWIYHR